jgi:hypothetical protein
MGRLEGGLTAGVDELGHLAHGLGQAEVEDLDPLVPARRAQQEDVLRLEIPMDEARRVRLGEARADLVGDGQGTRGRQPGLALEEFPQVLAPQVLHHEVDETFPRAEVEDRDGVGVREFGDEQGLAPEAPHELWLRAQMRPQDLDGDPLADAHVLGQVHRAHAALPQPLDDPVAVVDHRAEERVLLGAGRGAQGRAATAAERVRRRGRDPADRAMTRHLGQRQRRRARLRRRGDLGVEADLRRRGSGGGHG